MAAENMDGAFVGFWTALENLLSAGLPIVRSLRALAAEADTAQLKAVAECLAMHVSRGTSLGEAMEALGVFLPSEVELVAVGEETGMLDKVCGQIADKLRKGACLGRRPAITVGAVRKASRAAAPSDMARKATAMINSAVRRRASDIHIEQSADKTHVRLRIAGALDEGEVMAKRDGRSLCATLKAMAGLDIGEKRIPQDGRAPLATKDAEYQLRVASTPTRLGENVTIRILNTSSVKIDVADLCEPDEAELLQALADRPNGIVFVTGPMGSGKTTVLYAMLHVIKTRHPGTKIWSVEDPIEYPVEGVSQIQVDPSIGLTMPVALKHVFGCDPDVICVGEATWLKDHESVEAMVQLALTGHLVLTTMHAQDAMAALDRVMQLIPRRELLVDAVAAITSQRLIRCLCDKCKVKQTASKEELSVMGLDPSSRDMELWKPKRCAKCGRTGYRGRKGIFEILTIEDEVAELIRDGAELPLIKQAAVEAGMRTLRQSAISAALSGMTSLEEALRVAG